MLKYFSINTFKMLKNTTVISCVLVAPLSQASLTNRSTLNLQAPETISNTENGFKGSVLFQSNQWMDDVGEVVGNKYFGEVDLSYNSKTLGSSDKKFEFKSRINDEEQFQFSLPESYVRMDFGENNEIYIGRKILPWNTLDSTWGFGKLNNRINFDGFEPGQEGLTGATVNFNFDSGFKISLFGTGIYVPELNPGTKINKDDGTIECQNAWCKAPDAGADTNQDGVADKDIFYSVDMPDISDIVFKYAAGASFGFENENHRVNAFGIRKPENNISLSVEVSFDAREDIVNADVTPQVFYHNIAGAEYALKAIKNTELYASYLRIKPDNNPDETEPLIVYTGIKPNKKFEEYLGAGTRYKNGDFAASVNYIARVSEYNVSEDTLVEYPRWNQAINLSLSTKLSRKLALAFDYKYDMLTDDRLTMLKANYQFRPNMVFSAGANVIGSDDTADSYWSDFVNNDTVYSSFKYIF
jgi:hypothetical protein